MEYKSNGGAGGSASNPPNGSIDVNTFNKSIIIQELKQCEPIRAGAIANGGAGSSARSVEILPNGLPSGLKRLNISNEILNAFKPPNYHNGKFVPKEQPTGITSLPVNGIGTVWKKTPRFRQKNYKNSRQTLRRKNRLSTQAN